MHALKKGIQLQAPYGSQHQRSYTYQDSYAQSSDNALPEELPILHVKLFGISHLVSLISLAGLYLRLRQLSKRRVSECYHPSAVYGSIEGEIEAPVHESTSSLVP